MAKQPDKLAVDLQGGMVPISKTAAALASLIKRGRERWQPIIITQKGYPTAVLLPLDLYLALRDRAVGGAAADTAQEPSPHAEPEPIVEEAPTPEAISPTPSRKPRGGRKAKV